MITVTISDISVGYEHVLALSSDGDIYSWGRGKNGRLGHGNQETQTKPVKILTDINFKLIFAGFNHSIASKFKRIQPKFYLEIDPHERFSFKYGCFICVRIKQI